MKKSTTTKKKTPAKKPITPKKAVPAASASKTPLVGKQPQSKQESAVKAGMFLYTDDNWSAAYFNSGDLRYMERELLG